MPLCVQPSRRRRPRRPSVSAGRRLACFVVVPILSYQDATVKPAEQQTGSSDVEAMPTATDATRTMQEDCGTWPRLSDLVVPVRTGWKICALQGGEGAGQASLRHGNQESRVVKWAESSAKLVAGTHWADRRRSDGMREYWLAESNPVPVTVVDCAWRTDSHSPMSSGTRRAGVPRGFFEDNSVSCARMKKVR